MRALGSALAALGLLAGCSQTPTTLANPRDSIMLQYDPAKTSDGAVEDVAQKHCQSWGRTAVSARKEEKNGQQVQTFDCR